MHKTDTHQLFNTISHEHLDDLVSWATGEYPDSGLILVECEEGRWFIEQEFGHAFDSFSGISKPKSNSYIEPNFYLTREEALLIALELIKQVYKNIRGSVE